MATPISVESQMHTKSSVTVNAAYSDSNPEAGKPLGIAMFSLLIIARLYLPRTNYFIHCPDYNDFNCLLLRSMPRLHLSASA